MAIKKVSRKGAPTKKQTPKRASKNQSKTGRAARSPERGKRVLKGQSKTGGGGVSDHMLSRGPGLGITRTPITVRNRPDRPTGVTRTPITVRNRPAPKTSRRLKQRR